jgi:hypothetical protein
MAVRANVTIALRSGEQTETDVFMQGEETFRSNALVQEHILNAVRDMEEYDWIAFCVIPADFAATDVATPLAYQGQKPSNAKLDELGFDMVGYLGRCKSSSDEAGRCTDYLGHEAEGSACLDRAGNVWYNEDYADRILGG